MLAPFHLGKRDSGSKNIISINKLTNLFIKVIKNFLRLSPAGLCFPSSSACLSHHPALSFSVIIRLDRGSFNLDCPIKSGNDIKGIK